MTKTKCDYWIQANTLSAIAIVDMNQGAMSVTNDAEAVVAALFLEGKAVEGKRIVYRDSEGRWDELRHDGAGNFTGFAPLGVSTLDEALQKIES